MLYIQNDVSSCWGVKANTYNLIILAGMLNLCIQNDESSCRM